MEDTLVCTSMNKINRCLGIYAFYCTKIEELKQVEHSVKQQLFTRLEPHVFGKLINLIHN